MNRFFLREALKQSLISYKLGEVPVGCVICNDNEIISKGYNLRESTNVLTNHAEIISINKACRNLNSWRLNNLSMYVTLEPCVMCGGAIFESRIKTLYIGACNNFNGFFSSNYHKNFEGLNVVWLNDKTCEYILNRFFQKIRKR